MQETAAPAAHLVEYVVLLVVPADVLPLSKRRAPAQHIIRQRANAPAVQLQQAKTQQVHVIHC
jgi:cytochrome b561